MENGVAATSACFRENANIHIVPRVVFVFPDCCLISFWCCGSCAGFGVLPLQGYRELCGWELEARPPLPQPCPWPPFHAGEGRASPGETWDQQDSTAVLCGAMGDVSRVAATSEKT